MDEKVENQLISTVLSNGNATSAAILFLGVQLSKVAEAMTLKNNAELVINDLAGMLLSLRSGGEWSGEMDSLLVALGVDLNATGN